MNEQFREKLAALPEEPGIYRFLDAAGKVIYVGKARNLAARVRSYFAEGRDGRPISRDAEAVIADVEVLLVGRDKQAFIVENSVIKENQPRYNVRLKDDKDFLHIRVDLSAPWPRLELVRRPKTGQRQVKLFGPYHSARSARRTMLLASRHFKLRTCKDTALRNRTRPCLLYQMDRCPGPCVYEVDREQYLEQVRLATLFLAGRRGELLELLRQKMAAASAALAFEAAAMYRDQIRAVEQTLESQHVVQLAEVDQDVFGIHRDSGIIQVVVLEVRGGKLVSSSEFHWKGFDLPVPLEEMLSSLVVQHYPTGAFVPDEVLLPLEVDDPEGLSELLGERLGRTVKVHRPQRGPRARLLELAERNVQQAMVMRRRSEDDAEAALTGIAEKLGLAGPPKRIECFDVAHHQTGRAVAAMAVLEQGRPSPKASRSYTIRTAKVGDDYGGLYEVLSRRFRRAREGETGWELPDLLVIDGGRGQLAVARAALVDVGLEPATVPIVGLAKERSARRSNEGSVVKDATEERLYLRNRVNPITIRGTSPLLLLCHARDEAHRLAGKQLARYRKQTLKRSALDGIPGVGPSLRRSLLKALGSLRAIEAATVEELTAAPGVGEKLARKIHDHFHGTS